MQRTDNYKIQVQQAQERFLGYDAGKIAEKCNIPRDEDWLYPVLLGAPCRLSLHTGRMERRMGGQWVDANSHGEVMTVLDLLCDSREDRWCSGKLCSFQSFGRIFYSGCGEKREDPWARWIQDNAHAVDLACRELGAQPAAGGDRSWCFRLFEDVKLVLQFWESDEDFPASIQWFWEENAWMYLRFETMHFAVGMVLNRIREQVRHGGQTQERPQDAVV